MDNKKKIYFVSDTHFGTPDYKTSLAREKKFIRFLEKVEQDGKALFLVGDIFDFWFDYKHTVPKGFVRVLGKLAQMSDNGIELHYFKGNHDMWLNGYFEEELGCQVHSNEYILKENGVTIYIAHGDGKGPRDFRYKRLKKIFRNPICQWMFSWLHPNIGMAIANAWSKDSRYGNGEERKETFLGEDDEWLVQYVKRKKDEIPAQYFIFGHRHLALDIPIDDNVKYINLGDWLHYCSYAVLENKTVSLEYFKE